MGLTSDPSNGARPGPAPSHRTARAVPIAYDATCPRTQPCRARGPDREGSELGAALPCCSLRPSRAAAPPGGAILRFREANRGLTSKTTVASPGRHGRPGMRNWSNNLLASILVAGRVASVNPPAPDSGELIAGKYRVERVIGEGGMGTVLAAWHELLDVRVAVKVLSAELSHQPEIIARFLREARAVARLKSEHVARVMDVGILGEGQPFIVMELLEGEDLEKWVQRGPLPVQQAADFILQALEAMAHAHAIGIIHRDLKPANLFVTVTPDGREVVKVLDFGIAKLTNAV